MQYTENFALRKPQGGEPGSVGDINYNSDKVDELFYQTRGMQADAYDSTQTYNKDALVMYSNVLYKAKEDGITGTWDANKWEATDLAAEIMNGGAKVTKTATGNPVEFSDGADAPLVKCTTEIQGSQDLHGYDKPWVGGSGKNKFDPESTSDLWVLQDGTQTHSSAVKTVTRSVSAGENVTLSNKNNSSTSNILLLVFYDSSNNLLLRLPMATGSKYISGTAPENTSYVLASFYTWSLSDEQQLEIGVSFPTAYEPYSNICPITAYTEGEIEVSDGDGNVTTHTTTYPSAIYRGSDDVVNGEVKSEMLVIDLGDLTWSAYTTDTTGHSFYVNVPTGVKSVSSDSSVANMVCENYETVAFINPSEWLRRDAIICQVPNTQRWIVRDERYSDATAFTTAMNGVQLAYELATPTTTSVTPTNLPIKSLSGYNHIESSTGEMEVEYITEVYQPLVDLIPDDSGGGKHVYSTDEQVVGTWIDGRDVYETTLSIYYTSHNENLVEYVDELISGFDNTGYIIYSQCFCEFIEGSTRYKSFKRSYEAVEWITSNSRWRINVQLGSATASKIQWIVILRYVKGSLLPS